MFSTQLSLSKQANTYVLIQLYPLNYIHNPSFLWLEPFTHSNYIDKWRMIQLSADCLHPAGNKDWHKWTASNRIIIDCLYQPSTFSDTLKIWPLWS